MKGFFDQIPRELDEAAMIDGCSRVPALAHVIFPVSLPGVVAAGIFAFIGAWDELVFALTFTSSDAVRTLPVGLQRFITSYEVQWNHLAAGSVIVTVPVIIMFLFIQRFLGKGIIAGSVKG
ncbi:MAG: carbohydrate ABC transporter permease [Spirochaetota bacterium]